MIGSRDAVLTGFGVALPARITQHAAWEGYFGRRFNRVRGAKLAFDAAGVTTRHAVANPLLEDVADWSTGARMSRYAAEALPLGKEALAAAFDRAGVAADEVGMLVTVSCTGYSTPGIDIGLAEGFAMPPTLERLHVGHMGCHGAFPALDAATRFVALSGRVAVVLCVELASLHVQPPSDDIEQAVVHALFGDAAAAVVVEPGSTRHGFAAVDSEYRTETAGAELMTWRVTDHGFRMTLSRTVADVIAPRAAEVVDELLRRNNLTRSDIAHWVVHPGGPRILDRVGAAIGIGSEQLALSRSVLADHGNCSSATVLMILSRLQQRPAPTGAQVVAVGFGPGLTTAATLLRVT